MCALNTNMCLSVVLKGTECLVFLKLKGHRFPFLLDRDGEFVQPTLFDETVGIERF